jgi:DNA-binding FrmR family transcriptional regulator
MEHDHNKGTRKAHHSEKLKSNLTSRLNRVEGQIKAVKRLIDEDTYCDEVLNLISSVQSALNSTAVLLVEHHVKSCVVDQIKSGDTEVISELITTIKKLTK